MAKPFSDNSEAEKRILHDSTPLTAEEVLELRPFVRSCSRSAREILETDLALIQIAALLRQEGLAHRQLESFSKFDKATAKANGWMIGFTAVVTVMTLIMLLLALFGSPWAK